MTVAVTPLSYDDIQTWLSGLVTAAEIDGFPQFNEGPYIPELPNQLCTITLTPGAGYQMEGAADQPQFQIRFRSDQGASSAPGRNPAQSVTETNAFALDKLIFTAALPTKLKSGMNLLLVARVGGAPSTLGPPDASYRFDYVCNYYAVVGVPKT